MAESLAHDCSRHVEIIGWSRRTSSTRGYRDAEIKFWKESNSLYFSKHIGRLSIQTFRAKTHRPEAAFARFRIDVVEFGGIRPVVISHAPKRRFRSHPRIP